MKQLNNYKIQTRLILIIAPVLLIGALISGWALVTINRLDEQADYLRLAAGEAYRARETSINIHQMQLDAINFVVTDDNRYIARHDILLESIERYSREIESVDDFLFGGYPELSIRDDVITFQAQVEEYERLWDEFWQTDNPEEAGEIFFQMLTTNNEMIVTVDSIYTVFDDYQTSINFEIEDHYLTLLYLGEVGILLFAVLILVTIIIVGRQIAAPMIQITEAAEHVTRDEFKPEHVQGLVERGDEIGYLARAIQKMALELDADEAELEAEIAEIRTKLRNLRREKELA